MPMQLEIGRMAHSAKADWPAQWFVPYQAPICIDDPVSPSRAVAIGMLLGVGFWIGVGATVWLLA